MILFVEFESRTVEIGFFVLAVIAAALLLFIGYRVGKWIGTVASTKLIETKEQELFTAQKSFKSLYEQELANLKTENAELRDQVETLDKRVEEYRKKAAGFGGLFSSGGKRADAMYALLLENEALEEALYSQNEKLRQERTDALREQMRNTSYRRVLMSQLLTDDRIKGYVSEVLADDRRLPDPQQDRPALPAHDHEVDEKHEPR
jgi:predicted RNase H-like nuclease (RuvC/YqgF family)